VTHKQDGGYKFWTFCSFVTLTFWISSATFAGFLNLLLGAHLFLLEEDYAVGKKLGVSLNSIYPGKFDEIQW
jgi:hypothetical protein